MDSPSWFYVSDNNLKDILNDPSAKTRSGRRDQRIGARKELDRRAAEKKLKDEFKEEKKKEKKTTQMRRVLKSINREITIKDFIALTGMKPSTARRELGQATNPKSKHFTKDIVRVGKKGSGVYRFK